MTHTKATPGPWHLDKTANMNGISIQDVRGYRVANCRSYSRTIPRSEALSNAALIAAAPDLYESLRGLLADITEYQELNNLGGKNNHWQVTARAAIARATGAV